MLLWRGIIEVPLNWIGSMMLLVSLWKELHEAQLQLLNLAKEKMPALHRNGNAYIRFNLKFYSQIRTYVATDSGFHTVCFTG